MCGFVNFQKMPRSLLKNNLVIDPRPEFSLIELNAKMRHFCNFEKY